MGQGVGQKHLGWARVNVLGKWGIAHFKFVKMSQANYRTGFFSKMGYLRKPYNIVFLSLVMTLKSVTMDMLTWYLLLPNAKQICLLRTGLSKDLFKTSKFQ